MPKPEAVTRILEEISKGYSQYLYFLNNLNSPEWLEPLARNNFFQDPPGPKPDGGYVRLAMWPESKYLVRMSNIPEAQKEVLAIALRIPDTQNGRVHDDIADIALSLPPDLSVKLVPQICRYTKSPYQFLLWEKIASLIVHLADGNQEQAALRLTGAALALSPEPKSDEDDESPFSTIADPQPRFSEWHYGRILKKALPSLLSRSPLDTLNLVCGLLDDAATFSFRNAADDDEDYFYVRQPAIEIGVGRDDDSRTLLLCAARDAAEQIVSRNPSDFANVMAILQRHRWTSFRRLELHLSRVFPDQGVATAERFFQDPSVLRHPGLGYEAVLLLNDSFGKLSATTQQKILDWMDAGPSEESIRSFLEFGNQEVTDERIREIKDVRRRNQFSILEGQLPERYQKIYEALTKTFGQADPPDRLPIRTFSQVGANSPKTAADLAGMGIDEVIEYLASWTPGTDIFGPTADGLGSALTPTISQRPAEFAASADRFKALDPTYVRAFFAGLTAALKEGRKFDWKPVFDLAIWVSNEPRDLEGQKGRGRMIADQGWGWTRDSILDLLKEGFQGGDARLPFEHRELAWRALSRLTEDPYPSAENEGGEGFDPSFLSLNCTRGRALFATMEYAEWVRKCERTRKPEQAPIALDGMPEVREVLNRHLDIKNEPRLTIRSVYGQELAWLAALDWEWFRGNVGRILPLEQADSAYFNAAWDGFIVFNQPNDALLRELMPAYKKAIDEMNAPRKTRSHGSPIDSLADHLMAYYWRDQLRFEGTDRLLADFYDLAPDSVRGHAMWFIGRSLAGWNDNAPAEVFERLWRLMDRRLKAAEKSAVPVNFAKELASFGWWFTSNMLGDEWSIRTLLRVLRLTKKVNDEMDVVKILETLCQKFPSECIECLALMVEGDEDQWIVISVEAEVRRTIEIGLRSPEAAEAARRLIELLIGKGQYGFRNLLSQ